MKEAKRVKNIGKGAAEIKVYIVGKSRCKLLVATSGKEVTTDTKRSIAFAIEKLTGEVPTQIRKIKKNTDKNIRLSARKHGRDQEELLVHGPTG